MRIKHALIALLLLLAAPAHAQQNKVAMTATIASCFPTQSVGAITPASVVTCLTTLINSYQQATQVRTVTGTTDTLATTDYGNLIRYSSASPVAVTLSQATGTFGTFNFFATNNGTAAATITPATSTIGGSSSLTLAPGQSAFIVSDGVNWDTWQTAQVASNTTLGLAQCDGVTVICSAGGVLTAIAATGASITIGTTTITSGTNGNCLNVTTGKLGQQSCASLTASDQTVSGGANIVPFSYGVVTTGTITIDCGKNAGQWLVNGGSFTLAAPTTDGLCAVEVIGNNAAGTITLSNFSSKGAQGATYSVTPTQAATATFTNATATITWITNTLLSLNAPVYFTNSGGGLPTGFTAGTIYYISGLFSTNQIQVSATPTGAAIVAGSAGTGTQTGDLPTVFDLSVTRINGNTLGVWSQAQ
jgi:hypothetical protein